MAKTSKMQTMILTSQDQLKNLDNVGAVLIYPSKITTSGLIQSAFSNDLVVNCIVDDDPDNAFIGQSLSQLGYPSGCYIVINYQSKKDVKDITGAFSNNLQLGYRAAIIINKSDYSQNDLKTFKQYGVIVIDHTDVKDNLLNVPELLTSRSLAMVRDYTNVDIADAGPGAFVGVGKDTSGLGGGRSFGYSTNGQDFYAVITPKGLVFRQIDALRMWRLLKPQQTAQIGDFFNNKVAKEIEAQNESLKSAVSNANEAVKRADSAVANSKVNSDAIKAMNSAIAAAQDDANSAAAAIQQARANASSDAANIRSDVAKVESEVASAKSANQVSVNALQSDIDAAKKDLADAHSGLLKAKAAVEQNKKLINDSVAKINNDIAQNRKDLATTSDQLTSAQKSIADNRQALDSSVADINNKIAQDHKDVAAAQQANADMAKKLNSYTNQAIEQGKTIEKLQTDDNSTKLTIADIKGNVSQVQDSVNGLTANLKDANNNLAAVKALADSLSATLTDHGKNIASLQATAKELSSTLSDADGRLSKVEQTAKTQSTTLSNVQGNLSQVKQEADSLTANLKDTQGNIAKVQATAKGLSEQITTAQGDITALQTDVSGIKATIANHDKNIHTLQADSKSLQDDMADAKGNISSLQKTATDLTSEVQDHSGRLSKVEQTAKEQSTTLSTVQGNISQVKQTADGLVTTLKDAQGNIDKVRATAKGLSEQISNAQGDITGLQTDVFGIKATIADHEKNIHTLQVDSKSLTDKMTDAQGNISKFQKTATDLTSEMQDHSGRLSKVEQTASTLINEFSDQQGHLNRIEQTANGTEQTVANQQGQINTIKTDATGIHETLTGQGNQIANINVTLSGLNSKYEGVSGDLGKLKDQVTTNSTQITQNQKAIDLKADQSTVNSLSGEVSQAQAQLKVQAGQISSKVSSTDFKTLDDKVNNMKIGGRNLLLGTSTNEASGKSYVFKQYIIAGGLKPNTTYTFSGWAQVDQKAMDNKQNVFVCAYTNDWSWSQWLNISSSLTAKYSKVTFTTPTGDNFAPYVTVYLRHPNNDPSKDSISGQGFISKLKLEEGNVATAWTPAPEDTITAIQKNTTAINQTNHNISLKADQKEFDKVKGTAINNSSRLDVMDNEIKSKVTSTDVNNIVDGKGYATTSTVQSLITQKAGKINESITNLDAKYKAKDGVNLVRASSFHNVTLDDLKNSGWSLYDKAWINKNGGSNKQGSIVIDATSITTGVEDIVQTIPLEPDTDYTLSFHLLYAGVAPGNSFNAWSYVVEEDSNGKAVSPYVDNNHPMLNSDDRKLNTRTFHTSKNTHQGVLYLRAMPGTKVELEEVKLERGTVATQWTPDPYDNATVTQFQQITASIDGLQSTVANKADTSQITQLSNLIQSKVSSSDFTSKISQLSNDINARVSKGDLMSQINIEAKQTLIQSNKLFLDADSVFFSGKAFIPDAAIENLSLDKLTTGHITIPLTDKFGNEIELGREGIEISSAFSTGDDGSDSSTSSNDSSQKDKSAFKLRLSSNGVTFANQIEYGDTSKHIHKSDEYQFLNLRPDILHETNGSSDEFRTPSGMTMYVPVNYSSDLGPSSPGGFFALGHETTGEANGTDRGIDIAYVTKPINDWEKGLHVRTSMHILPPGADHGIHSVWVSWSNWDNAEKYPALVQEGSDWGGIAFPKSGRVTLFDANGRYYTPDRNTGIGPYNDYERG